MSGIYSKFGFASEIQFLFFIGIVTFITLSISTVFKTLATYHQLKFVLYIESYLGSQLYELYLNQNYLWLAKHHSAELGKNILSEVGGVVANGVMPVTVIIAQTSVAFAMIAFLFFVDPVIT